MYQANRNTQLLSQDRMAANRRGIVIIDIDLGTHPEGLLATPNRAANGVDDFVYPRIGHGPRLDRLSALRFFIQNRDVQIAMHRLGQRSRYRRCTHHQHVRRRGLAHQPHAILHTKAMLLVHDDEAEIPKADRFLKQGVRSGNNMDRPVCEPEKCAFPYRAFVSSGQRSYDIALR